jgi:undecaprenyl-diphosphatase
VPELLVAIILGVVEGVTEFLPISSTGHLVLCEKWLGINLEDDPFWKMFAVFIQIGAIASVVVYFRERIVSLLRGRNAPQPTPLEASAMVREAPAAPVGSSASTASDGIQTALMERVAAVRATPVIFRRNHALWMIVIGSLPLAIAYVAHKWAEKNLESTTVVAMALLIGGVLMIAIEYLRPVPTTPSIEEMTWGQALGIGLAQIVAALFPGTSRSAATIMGGELAGLSRPAAAEFSFFLAIPAMGAACTFSLLKHRTALDARHWLLLAVGTLVSFLVAWLVIAAFMSFIRRHSFVPFAIYRIGLAIVVLLAFR